MGPHPGAARRPTVALRAEITRPEDQMDPDASSRRGLRARAAGTAAVALVAALVGGGVVAVVDGSGDGAPAASPSPGVTAAATDGPPAAATAGAPSAGVD